MFNQPCMIYILFFRFFVVFLLTIFIIIIIDIDIDLTTKTVYLYIQQQQMKIITVKSSYFQKMVITKRKKSLIKY